jgi:hypothetical protein
MMTELEAPARHPFGMNRSVMTMNTILVIDDEEGIRAPPQDDPRRGRL